MRTVRVTTAQAIIRFLRAQQVERDGARLPFFAGCFGIFGHGNVAGIGQALQQTPEFRYYQTRNEQAMVHTAAAFAKMHNRLRAFACTTSIGPGATNMLTAAAGATINRLPVLLLPGDIFARRNVAPVLKQLEQPYSQDLSVNDCFKPISRYWDRINRPEQIIRALPEAMRVLTSPAETGAVPLSLPQDVQAEAYEYPADFFEERAWLVARPHPDPALLERAVEWIVASQQPLIIAGGGVIYSEATEALRELAEATGIPVAETQAGKGALRYDHPLALGAMGVTGTPGANILGREADLVIGVGTRYSDFTTASKTAFQNPEVRFLNINIAEFDAFKHAALPLVADARAALGALAGVLKGYRVPEHYRARAEKFNREWDAEVSRLYNLEHGSSCMGYEIAGGLGVKLAAPDREVYVMVGDGSYLMMNSEIVTSLQEGYKLTVVLIDNHGFSSIGGLSQSLGSGGFGTRYRYRNPETGQLDGDLLPVDFAANARSLGAAVHSATDLPALASALEQARAEPRTTVIVVETDPEERVPGYESWWDVPVAEVSEMAEVKAARREYQSARSRERDHL